MSKKNNKKKNRRNASRPDHAPKAPDPAAPHAGPRLSLEALEPRILLSATWVGTDGDDVYHGTNKDDTIYGVGGNNELHGGNGNDIIYGGDGDDLLFGGNGHDILISGGGNDFMSGGNGNDIFRFTGSKNGNVITVDGGNGKDTIDLSEYGNESISDDGSSIVVDLGNNESFTINYVKVDKITTADGTYNPGELGTQQGGAEPDADGDPDPVDAVDEQPDDDGDEQPVDEAPAPGDDDVVDEEGAQDDEGAPVNEEDEQPVYEVPAPGDEDVVEEEGAQDDEGAPVNEEDEQPVDEVPAPGDEDVAEEEGAQDDEGAPVNEEDEQPVDEVPAPGDSGGTGKLVADMTQDEPAVSQPSTPNAPKGGGTGPVVSTPVNGNIPTPPDAGNDSAPSAGPPRSDADASADQNNGHGETTWDGQEDIGVLNPLDDVEGEVEVAIGDTDPVGMEFADRPADLAGSDPVGEAFETERTVELTAPTRGSGGPTLVAPQAGKTVNDLFDEVNVRDRGPLGSTVASAAGMSSAEVRDMSQARHDDTEVSDRRRAEQQENEQTHHGVTLDGEVKEDADGRQAEASAAVPTSADGFLARMWALIRGMSAVTKRQDRVFSDDDLSHRRGR